MDSHTKMTDNEDRQRAIEEARQLITAGMVAELIVEVRHMAGSVSRFADTLAQTVATLAQTQDRVAELDSLRHRNSRFASASLLLAAGLAVVVVVLGLVLWRGNNQLTDITEASNRQGRLLVECTTPAPTNPTDEDDAVHECFDAGTESQTRAVAAINDAIVRGAVCARRHATEADIQVCVATPTTTTEP